MKILDNLNIPQSKFPWSKVLIFVIFVFLVIFYHLNPFSNVLAYDVFGYYLYLPAKFIYNDLALHDQTWLKAILDKYHNVPVFCQAEVLENGNRVMVSTMGLALLNAPFFFLACLITPLTRYPADGFSYPYQLAVFLSAQVYMGAGLIFLRKLLLKFVNEKISCLAILLLVFGTNYFHNSTYLVTMPHSYLFTLVVILLWALMKWEEKNKWKYAMIIGISGGFITLIRPTEMIIFLLPLLWGVFNKRTFTGRMKLLYAHKKQVLILVVSALIVQLPQMIYWKTLTGSWIFYSYSDREVFLFSSPFLAEVLFGFRKGWLVYTPLMIFSLIGFIFLYKRRKELFWPVLLYIVLNIYLISSWSTWWYGSGDFSQRAMVSSYAVLIIPLALLLDDMMKRKIKYLILSVLVFIVALNLFQTWQFSHGIIHTHRMTQNYYFRVFGKTKVNPGDLKYLSVNRDGICYDSIENINQYNHKVIGLWDFENIVEKDKKYYVSEPFVSGKYAFAMDSAMRFSPGPSIPFKDITGKEYVWVRSGVDIFIPEGYQGAPPLLVCTFGSPQGNYGYMTSEINNDTLKAGSWNHIVLNYLTPEIRRKRDKLYVYIWHRGNQKILIDDLKVEVFEPKSTY